MASVPSASSVFSRRVHLCRPKNIMRGLCIAVVFVLGSLVYMQSQVGLQERTEIRAKVPVSPDGDRKWVIPDDLSSPQSVSPGKEPVVCKQPELELNPPEIAYWFHDLKPFTCKGRDDVFAIRDNVITIDLFKVGQYGDDNFDSCSFWSLKRIDDEEGHFEYEAEEWVVDNSAIVTEDSVNIRLNFTIKTDFFKVKCGDDGFERYFSHIHPKPDLLIPQRHPPLKMSSNPFEDVSVLMLGFDSTSRMNFMRKLPNAYEYLTKKMGAVVLKGYNIVGDATAGAFIPMLTGYTESELPNVQKSVWFEPQYVDVYPLIWKQYKKKGYATQFAEDKPGFAAFNLRLNGFKEQPTDHYMRPFWHTVDEGPTFCYGSLAKHVMMFDYLKEFQLAYTGHRPRFGFTFLTQISHEDLNIIELVEGDLLDFLRGLYEGGHLENTILVVFGDHGPRYGEVRDSPQGKIEERLPFMSITLPESIRRTNPEVMKNLQTNADRLSTPFDMYATLADVIGYKDSNLPAPNGLPRAISLFSKILATRTCRDAGIETHWCACLQWKPIPPDDGVSMTVAYYLVGHLNALLKPYKHLCHQLSVSNVTRAERVEPNEDNGISSTDVHITIETKPGHALFDATVHTFRNGSMTVTTDISRINKYGNQSACVMDKNPQLRQFCYCKRQ